MTDAAPATATIPAAAPAAVPDTKTNSDPKTIILRLVALFFVIWAIVATARFANNIAWKRACVLGVVNEQFDVLNFDSYGDWMDENTEYHVPGIGMYKGLEGTEEYIRWVLPKPQWYLDYYKIRKPSQAFPISLTKEECVFTTATKIKVQIAPKFDKNGGTCAEYILTTKLFYTVDDLKGNGFHVNQFHIYHPPEALATISDPGGEYPEHWCNTLRDFCPEVYEANGLDEETCLSKWDELPDNSDSLQGNTKGCRLYHASFAKENDKHCPHLSFMPMEDYHGNIKCQNPTDDPKENMFTAYDFSLANQYAIESGFESGDLVKQCEYESEFDTTTIDFENPDADALDRYGNDITKNFN